MNEGRKEMRRKLNRVMGIILELRLELPEVVDREASRPEAEAVVQRVPRPLRSRDQFMVELGAGLLYLMLMNSPWMRTQPPTAI